MKILQTLTPAATLLCALMMLFFNLSLYQSDNWPWTNILLSVGILLTTIAYILMIIKNSQAFWMQLLGMLFSMVCLIPLFFKAFYAILSGQKDFLFSFLTMCIILILQMVLSMNSYKNIEKSQINS
jgi:hypothetical protein